MANVAPDLPPDPPAREDDRPVWRGGQSSGDDTADLGPWPSAPGGHWAADAEPPEQVTLAAIPDYPVGQIPGPLRQLVDGGAAMGLHPAFVGGAGLAALASVAGPADLVISGSWVVWPKLWVPLIDYPSTGKTPAHRFAFRSIHDLDRQVWSAYQRELADHRKMEGSKSQPDPPEKVARRLAEDTTTEVLCRWLIETGDESGGIAVDELKAFIHGIGYYGSGRTGRDMGRYMALWSCQPWSMQRVGQGGASVGIDLYLARPVVSICGCLTIEDQGLLGREGDGFRPRWLPHLGPGTLPVPKDIEPDTSAWDATIASLYENRQRRIWHLRGWARLMWERASQQWKARALGPETPSVVAALGKADEQCARIALVLAESMAPGHGGNIPDDAMGAAIAITEYVMGCWAALGGGKTFALSKYGEVLNQAVDELVMWLEKQPGRKATRGDIQRAHVAGVRKSKDMDVLLADYRDTYPGTVHTEQPDGGGRPRTVVCAPVRESFSPLATNSVTPPNRSQSSGKTAGQGNSTSDGELIAMTTNSSGEKLLATNSGACGDLDDDPPDAPMQWDDRHPGGTLGDDATPQQRQQPRHQSRAQRRGRGGRR